MKCGFCGSILEQGAEICPNCGMIISLGDTQQEDKAVETVYNVFKSNVERDKAEETKAQELAVDPTEEKVEFIMSLPEFEETAAPIIEDTVEDASQSLPEAEEIPADEAEEISEKAAEENSPMADEEIAPEAPEAENQLPEIEEIPLPESLAMGRVLEDIYSHSQDEKENEPEAAEANEAEEKPEAEEEESLDIRVPASNYIYSEYEDYSKPEDEQVKQEKKEKTEQAKKNLDKIVPAEKKAKKAPKKKKKGIDGIKIEGILGIAIALILVLFGSAYLAKNYLPTILPVDKTTEGSTTDSAQKQYAFIGENGEEVYQGDDGNYFYYDEDGNICPYVVIDETTEEETTEEETTEEETTEEETTEEETTEEETTAEEEITTEAATTTEATTKPTTTKPTTTKPTTTKPTTTKPTTTKPTTTRPTTTRPTTTKPTTTRPTTTKPTTTNPYGINDVTVKKPASYLAKSYTAYITAEGVILRNKPSADSERVLYLSKGADVLVLAKENGYVYIRSNRYGVYGWVSTKYTADERPQSESVVVSGTVSPDKKYGTVTTKYTTNGLNIRKGPGTSYDVIGLIPISYPVKVIGYKTGVSGWVYVQDTTYGYTGWVSSAYLK